jgi:hypothetical protein
MLHIEMFVLNADDCRMAGRRGTMGESGVFVFSSSFLLLEKGAGQSAVQVQAWISKHTARTRKI